MDNIEYLSDHRPKKGREYLELMLKKNSELLCVNVEILLEIGSDNDIADLTNLLEDINNIY